MIEIDKIVDKMDEMVKFYSEIFDVEFKPVELYGRNLYNYQIGEMEVLFCPRDLANVVAETNTIQLRFVIADVRSAYEKALKNGGLTITEVQKLEGKWHASLRDPDGNSLELIQAL